MLGLGWEDFAGVCVGGGGGEWGALDLTRER